MEDYSSERRDYVFFFFWPFSCKRHHGDCDIPRGISARLCKGRHLEFTIGLKDAIVKDRKCRNTSHCWRVVATLGGRVPDKNVLKEDAAAGRVRS